MRHVSTREPPRGRGAAFPQEGAGHPSEDADAGHDPQVFGVVVVLRRRCTRRKRTQEPGRTPPSPPPLPSAGGLCTAHGATAMGACPPPPPPPPRPGQPDHSAQTRAPPSPPPPQAHATVLLAKPGPLAAPPALQALHRDDPRAGVGLQGKTLGHMTGPQHPRTPTDGLRPPTSYRHQIGLRPAERWLMRTALRRCIPATGNVSWHCIRRRMTTPRVAGHPIGIGAGFGTRPRASPCQNLAAEYPVQCAVCPAVQRPAVIPSARPRERPYATG